MKIVVFPSLTFVAALSVAPLACEVHQPDLDIVQQFCAQAGWTYNEDGVPNGNRYEFRPLGVDPDNFGLCHPHDPPPTQLFMENQDLDPNTPPCEQPVPDRLLSEPAGSFEGDFWIKAGTLIVDDDDLTDDMANYEAGVALAKQLLSENLDAVETYKNIPVDKEEGEYTEEESDAVLFVSEVVGELLPLCPRLSDPDATGVPPRPGDDLLDGTFPSFTACKDKFDASGDGVVATFDLEREGGAEQDAMLASCLTTSAGQNQRALNIWGPLTTRESRVDGLPSELTDGFTFSGITVPVETSGYKWTMDRSQWEGVSFWARLADAEEAVPIGPTPNGLEPLSGGEIPDGARAQDGVGQVGIIIQTIDTGAVFNERQEMDFMDKIAVCEDDENPTDDFCFATRAEFDDFPGMVAEEENGVPIEKWAYHSEVGANLNPDEPLGPGTPATGPHPFCVDYSPVDIIVGEEPSYRDHCWDGFRTMLEVTPEWKYYFLPFSEMRQAGWGRVGESFRVDQLRSVNILTSAYQPVNVMIDEIAFYRSKKSDLAEAAAGGAPGN